MVVRVVRTTATPIPDASLLRTILNTLAGGALGCAAVNSAGTRSEQVAIALTPRSSTADTAGTTP